MLVTLGDGRTVECAKGITRLPDGPMPEVLASEIARPMTGKPASERDIDWTPPTRRRSSPIGNDPQDYAPVPVMLRARFPGPKPEAEAKPRSKSRKAA